MYANYMVNPIINDTLRVKRDSQTDHSDTAICAITVIRLYSESNIVIMIRENYIYRASFLLKNQQIYPLI